MPDIIAKGLGGGSIVSNELIDGSLTICPQSVGYQIIEKALVFGGDTLTTTDIAVAAGYADIGDKQLVADLSQEVIDAGVKAIHDLVADAVDRMKTSVDEIPLILVGGGSVLVHQDIPGVSEVIIPEHAGVANAIGASIAQVGGVVDKVYSYEEFGREQAIEDAKNQAISAAVDAGANRETVEVIDFEETPLSYVPGNTVRLKVKTAGDLQICQVK